MLITLSNDFHNTEVHLNITLGKPLSGYQIKRARMELCGIQGCACGGPLCERGNQKGFAVEQIDMERTVIVTT